MTVQVSYPGVYIDEVPSSVHTITGVATSITAFVGAATRGPTDTPTTIFSFADYQRQFANPADRGGISPSSPMSFAVNDFFRNGGGQAVIVRVANTAVAETITFGGGGGGGGGSSMVLTASSPGAWSKKLTATVDLNGTGLPATNFNLTIVDTGSGTTEKFLNLSFDPADPRFVTSVINNGSALATVTTAPTARPAAGAGTQSGAGADGGDITQAQVFATPKKGIFALDALDIFNLLVIPPYKISGADIAQSDYDAAAQYCKKRRAFLLVDPPEAWTTEALAKAGAVAYTNAGDGGKHSALFFPRVKETNPLTGALDTFIPSGAVAGVFARTDATRGVWKAPAGTEATLVGVPQMAVPLSDDECGDLNQIGVNCLRSFPIIGRVVWGSRTLAGADVLTSEWKYIPVRRLALFLEESLFRGTQWVVFEPNDEPLWSAIRLNVTSFMQQLFRQGAFQGASARDAYFVKCDSETTTQADINNGIVNIVVGFAPLKPAEFVIVHIQQLAGQLAT
ncbi:MAG: phage tail sheath C-terminal domain-containing protein [Deltaproteobacteria bacterium]